jgi:heme/copper-type cytochrome/quinol oxidase subunit 2
MTTVFWQLVTYIVVACATLAFGIVWDEDEMRDDGGKSALFWLMGAVMWPLFWLLVALVVVFHLLKRRFA